MSGIAAANLGITIGAQSDVVIIQSDVKTLQSDLVKTRSDMLITHSDVKAVNSDIKVLDPIIDTIKSDLIVTQSDVKVVISDLATLSTPVSTASATTAGTIVQDGSDGTPNGALVSSGVVANTFGAWVELDASTSAISWISHITLFSYNVNASNRSCVEIGTGGAGAEVTKIRFSYWSNTNDPTVHAHPMVFALPIPIKVANGTRIAARSSFAAANDVRTQVCLSMYQSLET